MLRIILTLLLLFTVGGSGDDNKGNRFRSTSSNSEHSTNSIDIDAASRLSENTPQQVLRAHHHSHVEVESMRPVSSEEHRFVKGSRAPSTMLHTVVFAVHKIRMDELRTRLDEISDPFSASYGNHLTRAEATAITANLEGSRKLLHFLETFPTTSSSSGGGSDRRVEVLETTPNSDYITARASLELWEQFFDTEFYLYHYKPTSSTGLKGDSLIRTMQYSLPVEVAADVLGVFNVVDLPSSQLRSKLKGEGVPIPIEALFANAAADADASAAGRIVPNFVTPALLNRVYSIDNNTGSSQVSQGVYETSNQKFSPNDLYLFQKYMGVAVEAIAVEIGSHGSNTACSDTTQGIENCLEGNLDVQYLMGMSQHTPTTYYYIDEQNFMLDFLISVAKMTSPPLVLSVSWGGPESQVTASYMAAVTNEAIILSSMGVTLIAASGDNGANDADLNQRAVYCGYSPLFPASSAYFTAVGATNGPQKGSSEIACQSDLGAVITSGGGISSLYRRAANDRVSSIPYWQTTQVNRYFSTVSPLPVAGYERNGRGYPDISLLGSNYIVVAGQYAQSVSGTSASAPVFAAMVSLVNAARKRAGKPSLGWINPALYQLSSEFVHDITSGNNMCTELQPCCSQGFYAAPGWDPVTGLGSVNFTSFKRAFLSLPSRTIAASSSAASRSRGMHPSVLLAVALLVILTTHQLITTAGDDGVVLRIKEAVQVT